MSKTELDLSEEVVEIIKCVTRGYKAKRLREDFESCVYAKINDLGYTVSDETRLAIFKACDSVSKKATKEN